MIEACKLTNRQCDGVAEHERELEDLAELVMVRVRRTYQNASAELQHATGELWLRQAAERLRTRARR